MNALRKGDVSMKRYNITNTLKRILLVSLFSLPISAAHAADEMGKGTAGSQVGVDVVELGSIGTLSAECRYFHGREEPVEATGSLSLMLCRETIRQNRGAAPKSRTRYFVRPEDCFDDDENGAHPVILKIDSGNVMEVSATGIPSGSVVRGVFRVKQVGITSLGIWGTLNPSDRGDYSARYGYATTGRPQEATLLVASPHKDAQLRLSSKELHCSFSVSID